MGIINSYLRILAYINPLTQYEQQAITKMAQHKKVLICLDNDKEAADYLAGCLSSEFSEHVNAIAFTSPVETLHYLKSNRVDLLTSCLPLPEMDGYEFIRQVKVLRPELPIIVTTDCGNIDSYFKAMYAGAFEFINKPISLPDLYKVASGAIGLKVKTDGNNTVPVEFKSKSLRKKIIVIADDHENILMAMCIVLERMGYDVVPAVNGQEAFNMLDIIKPDAIMADFDMPALDGVDALRRIKSKDGYADIPVLIISGEIPESVIDDCGKIGCSTFLKKPVGMHELSTTLERTLYPERGRKALRVDLNVQISVIYKGISQLRFSKTLSEKGIFVRTIDPLPTGSEVEVDLPLDTGRMRLKGRVIYINKIDSNTFSLHPGMTIEFVDVPAQDSGKLRDYVYRSICQGLHNDDLPPISPMDRHFHKGA